MAEFAHAALCVKDIERSRDFYSKILGFKVVSCTNEDGRIMCTFSTSENQHLILIEDPTNRFAGLVRTAIGLYPTGFHHLCFAVEDIQSEFAKISRLGCYVERGVVRGLDRNWQFWLRDPDGYPVEFMEMAPNAMQFMKEGD